MLTNETKRYIYERVMATAKAVIMEKLNESFGNTESIEILVSSLKGNDASTAVITAPTMDASKRLISSITQQSATNSSDSNSLEII